MPDVGDYQAAFGVEKFVIFEIGGHEGVGAGAQGIGQQKTAGASAYRHAPYRPAAQGRVAYA